MMYYSYLIYWFLLEITCVAETAKTGCFELSFQSLNFSSLYESCFIILIFFTTADGMRGQIVEQIKIIHFRGGEVKWGMGINPGYDELL